MSLATTEYVREVLEERGDDLPIFLPGAGFTLWTRPIFTHRRGPTDFRTSAWEGISIQDAHGWTVGTEFRDNSVMAITSCCGIYWPAERFERHNLGRAVVVSAPTQTPGPWAWQKMGTWCLTGQHGMRPIVLTVRKGEVTSLVGGLLTPLDPNHPDAHLIAAAPELFDALADFLCNTEVPARNCSCHLCPPCGDCVHYGALRDCIEAGQAAIAKALGQEVPL